MITRVVGYFLDILAFIIFLVIITLLAELWFIEKLNLLATDEATSSFTATLCEDDEYKTKLNNPLLTNEMASDNQLLGYIYFPKTDVISSIVQGDLTDGQLSAMDRGVAHDPLTPLPGENQNSVFAGHRHLAFSTFKDLENEDVIVVNINDNVFLYKIIKTEIIAPTETEKVFFTSEEETATFYTCYPFETYKPYDHRFVVRTEVIDSYEHKCAIDGGE